MQFAYYTEYTFTALYRAREANIAILSLHMYRRTCINALNIPLKWTYIGNSFRSSKAAVYFLTTFFQLYTFVRKHLFSAQTACLADRRTQYSLIVRNTFMQNPRDYCPHSSRHQKRTVARVTKFLKEIFLSASLKLLSSYYHFFIINE